jgi:hypothetical protein
MGMMRRIVIGIVATLVLAAGAASAQPLDRDPNHYFILAMRKALLKDITVSGGCHVGVNCASTRPGDVCGTMRLDEVSFADGTQSVSDAQFFTKPGAQVFQVFRNGGGPLTNVTIAQPPPQPFTTPIVPNSCSDDCQPDLTAIEMACGFPAPFPACDPSRAVTAHPNADCSAFDVVPGNGQCDLAPGAYGFVVVHNGARLSLAAGDYSMCSFRGGRNILVLGSGVSVSIPNGGFWKTNNGAVVGTGCGDLRIFVDGKGVVSFGRQGSIAAKVCAPGSLIRLGHGNTLTGSFIGDFVLSDLNNVGVCCGVAGASCACIDDFTPKTAGVGEVVTLLGHCDFITVTGVTICGIATPILTATPTEITVAVPPGAMGACPVEVQSTAGTFVHTTPLTVP